MSQRNRVISCVGSGVWGVGRPPPAACNKVRLSEPPDNTLVLLQTAHHHSGQFAVGRKPFPGRKGTMTIFEASTRVPTILVVAVPVVTLLVMLWALAVANDRNPLPFPDRDYHVFTARSEAGLIVLEEIMQRHGHDPRFRADSEGVMRTIFSNGTIINHAQPHILASLGDPSAALGFVVQDPDASAREVAALLRSRGFQANAIHGAEPGLPIAFVSTDALSGAALVFRKHLLQMGKRPDKWTSRALAVEASRPE